MIEEYGVIIFCFKEGNFLNYIGYVRKLCFVFVKSNGDLIVCDSVDVEVKIICFYGYNKFDFFVGDLVLDGLFVFVIYYWDRFFVFFLKIWCVKVFNEEGDFFYDIGMFRKVNE